MELAAQTASYAQIPETRPTHTHTQATRAGAGGGAESWGVGKAASRAPQLLSKSFRTFDAAPRGHLVN